MEESTSDFHRTHNAMALNEHFYPKGSLRSDPWECVVDSTISGWKYTGLRVATLIENQFLELENCGLERILIPLEGSFEIKYWVDESSEKVQNLQGRPGVFSGVTDIIYLPIDTRIEVRGSGRIAIAEAPTTELHPVKYTPAGDIAIEMRGAGSATRQVHNFGTPDNLAAGRLIVCEVITPAGNWSSYPPHKHDQFLPGVESELEEIYYFESEVERGRVAPSEVDPIGYIRNYRSQVGEIDTLAEVRSGDIALVPFGWHGPCIAAPGYDLYYLNVMAGPGAQREWLISDDPAHSWVRESWKTQGVDPRLPFSNNLAP